MSNLNRKITGLAVATLLATGLTACKEEKVEAQPMEQGYQNAEPAQPATAEPNTATATKLPKANAVRVNVAKQGAVPP